LLRVCQGRDEEGEVLKRKGVREVSGEEYFYELKFSIESLIDSRRLMERISPHRCQEMSEIF